MTWKDPSGHFVKKELVGGEHWKQEGQLADYCFHLDKKKFVTLYREMNVEMKKVQKNQKEKPRKEGICYVVSVFHSPP